MTPRATIAAMAHDSVEGSRRVHPDLCADSDLSTLVLWLTTCDPNGCYTDNDRDGEGWPPLDLDDAWEAVAHLCEENNDGDDVDIETQLQAYARETARDNGCDYITAVRMMDDERPTVATDLQLTEEQVEVWIDAQIAAAS